MIEQELLLLGLLKESPKHGYDIKKSLSGILGMFAGADVKSIYYPLRILEKRGLVLKRMHKEGKRPQRIVYELTPRGTLRFQQLLTESFLNFKRPQFSLDVSLYFLPFIDPDIARRRLRARMQVLKKLSRGLSSTISTFKKKPPASLVHILEHNLQMVETELRFLSHMVETL